jgi:hypothetical protein
MIWQPTGAAQPILRIEVRPSGRPPGIGPQVPAEARGVPGVAGGYLLGQSGVVYTDFCTATVGIHGAGRSADEASLIRLVSLVAARLPCLTIGRNHGPLGHN